MAVTAFAVYCVWNASWLSGGSLAPSLLTAVTGLPCPTTGGCRSIAALLHGDPWQCLAWNPFTIPILGLLACTAVWILAARRSGRRPAFSNRFALAWVAVLCMAWSYKLVEHVVAAHR